MRSFKKLGILVAVFALSAIGAASVSAATFTYSATGTFSGKATTTQVFTINGGQFKCTGAAATGTIEKVSGTELKETVQYSGCSMFGFANLHIPSNT